MLRGYTESCLPLACQVRHDAELPLDQHQLSAVMLSCSLTERSISRRLIVMGSRCSLSSRRDFDAGWCELLGLGVGGRELEIDSAASVHPQRKFSTSIRLSTDESIRVKRIVRPSREAPTLPLTLPRFSATTRDCLVVKSKYRSLVPPVGRSK
jgi:hypothetical protein